MADKRKSKNQSAKIILCVFAFVIFLLVFNIVYLGVTGKHLISGNNIQAYAVERGVSKSVEKTLYAKRGTIYTSDNEVIASDVKKYKLYAILSNTRLTAEKEPAYVVDKEETAKKLAPILKMDEADLLKRLNTKSYQVEFGKYGSSLSALVKDEIDKLNLPGLEFEEITTRNYRYGDFASYEVGYAQLMNDNSTKYIVGQMGIEKTYEDELKGTNGKKVYFADSNNYTLPNGVISQVDPVSGNDVYMTIDSDVQTELNVQMAKLAKEMNLTKGACAVMEAKTGRILGITNYPSFDPNKRDMENFNDMFINEAIEPGSIFKSFIYANAISDGKLNVEDKYLSGEYHVKGVKKPIYDHNKVGWGTITYKQGMYNSSNVAICNILSKFTDKDSLVQTYSDLGFFKSSTIDGLTSAAGYPGYKNGPLEYLNTGFGQGSSWTGLQLLRAYSVFANDGKTVEPYLVDKVVNSETGKTIYQAKSTYSKQIFTSDAIKQVNALMDGVINVKGSTGRAYAMDDVRLIGKTGTGEIAKDGAYLKNGWYTHSFAGLAPYEDPQVVIILWYQNQISGNKWSSNLVSSVVRTALNKLNAQPAKEVETSTFVLDSYTNQSVEYVKKVIGEHQLTPLVIGNGKTVLDQYPKASTEVSSKSRVFIQSDGTKITMPSMDGWSRKEAEAFALMANVKINFEGVGTIYKQSVSSGSALTTDQKINVYAK